MLKISLIVFIVSFVIFGLPYVIAQFIVDVAMGFSSLGNTFLGSLMLAVLSFISLKIAIILRKRFRLKHNLWQSFCYFVGFITPGPWVVQYIKTSTTSYGDAFFDDKFHRLCERWGFYEIVVIGSIIVISFLVSGIMSLVI